ncbi:unnamed protein product [Sphagnum jensenii]|uniref:Transposase n=1 Tax=Sphagnum jensenii TaxID=128206 RepID=A0ABP0VD59_9BRYO
MTQSADREPEQAHSIFIHPSVIRLPDHLVLLIYEKHDKGLSQRIIAHEVHISQNAVSRALRRRVGHFNQQKKVPLGRQRCTAAQTDRAIILTMRRDHFTSNEAIAETFAVSRESIRRRGIEVKLYSRIAHHDYLRTVHKSASSILGPASCAYKLPALDIFL